MPNMSEQKAVGFWVPGGKMANSNYIPHVDPDLERSHRRILQAEKNKQQKMTKLQVLVTRHSSR